MKTGLILSGGGANGAIQAGALAYLHQRRVRYSKVRGISVGALNGLMVALGKVPEMQQIWWMLRPEQIYRKRSLARVGAAYALHKIGVHPPPMGQYDNTPLYELLLEHARGVIKIPLMVGVVNAHTGQYVEKWFEPGTVMGAENLKWVLASTAIPGVFDAVKIGEHYFVDGGVRRQNPISPMLREGPDRVVIINCGVRGESFDRRVRNIADILANSLRAMMDEVFNVHQDNFHRINHLVSQSDDVLYSEDGKAYRYYPNISLGPKEPVGDAMDFSRGKARRLFTMGYERAETDWMEDHG